MAGGASPTAGHGTAFRDARIRRGLALDEAASILGVPARDLRALEWDRRDLLGLEHAESLARAYSRLLDQGSVAPSSATSARKRARKAVVLVAFALAATAVLAGALVLGGWSPARISAPERAQEATALGGTATGTQPSPPVEQRPASPQGKSRSTPAPREVLGLVGVARDEEIVLTWRPPPDATEVRVLRSVGSAPAALVYRGRDTRFVDQPLQTGVPHHYVVRAIDRQGRRSRGSRITITPG